MFHFLNDIADICRTLVDVDRQLCPKIDECFGKV